MFTANTYRMEDLVQYVYPDRKSVPYLYVNLKTYDPDNENVKLYCDMEKDELYGIAILYYDCLHFYTSRLESYPAERILTLIEALHPRVIMLQDKIGQAILEHMTPLFYTERNYIIDMDGVKPKENAVYQSTIVSKEDLVKIADLLLTEEEYSIVYDRKILIDSMIDRYDRGISRYVAVKVGDEVVASCSTYGETDDMAMIGGVIVHNQWRRRGLAADVENFICDILAKENKTRIGFVNFENGPSLALHTKLGAVPCAIYTKFIRK